MKRLIAVIAAVAASLSFIVSAAIVNGRFVDVKGAPIKNVVYKFINADDSAFVAVSGEDGRFTINLPGGAYTIEISASGYKTLRGNLSLNDDKIDLADQILQADSDTILVDNADLMKEGQHVEMMFLADEERCLTCELPTYVELEVTYSEPAVKGDTASTNALKEATLETGAIIMVPLFINQGEKIRVNTTDRSYGERVK